MADSAAKPAHWPASVQPITLDDIGKLGVDERDKSLHWDGHRVATRHKLHRFERIVAAIASASALVIAVVEVGRSLGCWRG